MKKPKFTDTDRLHRETIPAEYHFKDGELVEIGKRYAFANQSAAEVTAAAKSVAADYKAQIARHEAEAESLQTKITAGFEMRESEVWIQFLPEERVKVFRSLEDDSEIRRSEMTVRDFELHLPGIDEDDDPAGEKTTDTETA